MKEIKSYIRFDTNDPVVRELERVSARDHAIIRVDAFGAQADLEADAHHLLRKYSAPYSTAAKLEVVCLDADVARFVEIIRQFAHTGAHGDGRIFVSEVVEAVHIRTGASGESTL
jgi:nitrogen regulatory protein P-II 1